MKRLLFTLILITTLWFNFTPTASASYNNLTPCSDSAAYQQKSKHFLNTTDDQQSGQKRAERYAEALCGPEGYPHLIVDGNLTHIGDFAIPGIMFLYIAGWIGWVGRSYVQFARGSEKPTEKEIIIDVPVALSFVATGYVWPFAAFKEFTSGKLIAPADEITVSPR